MFLYIETSIFSIFLYIETLIWFHVLNIGITSSGDFFDTISNTINNMFTYF